MATVTNRRKVLSVEEKDKVIRETESGKRRLTCVRNSVWLIPPSKRFGKSRDKIVSVFEQNGSRIKRLRKPE
jgi:hypothetical protein